MNYDNILKQLEKQENIPAKEAEKEMQKALDLSGLEISVEDFIETVAKLLRKDYI